MEYTPTCHPLNPNEFLNEVQELRKNVNAPLLTDEILQKAKNQERI